MVNKFNDSLNIIYSFAINVNKKIVEFPSLIMSRRDKNHEEERVRSEMRTASPGRPTRLGISR